MTLRIIAGKYKGRLLKTPKGPKTRPTLAKLREAVFNICQHEISGARFLDLFAGSGAMGIEALSRGASHATFVENDRQALRCIAENIKTLQLESQTTVVRSLKTLTSSFDIVYLDPPYETPIAPIIDELFPLLAPNALLFIEERSTSHPSAPLSQLQHLDTRRFGIALLHQYKK